jgi:ATP-dependent exoDNAse (exonuclease V) beta subunit
VLFGAATPGLLAVDRDREALEAAESVRLLYVAATRARQRLVVSGLRPEGRAERPRCHADLLTRREGTPADLAVRLAAAAREGTGAVWESDTVLWRLPALAPAPVSLAGGRAVEETDVERVRRDAERLRSLAGEAAARAARPTVRTASEEEAWEEARAGEGAARVAAGARDAARETALAAGEAVHAWLEHLDLAEPAERWRDAGRRALAREHPGVAARAGALVERFLAGPLAERLRALAPHVIARELPVLAPPRPEHVLDADARAREPVGFWSGSIDLLVADPETGEIVVVDYKTDAVEGGAAVEERARSYAPQGRVYVRAVQDALALREPPRFELWFLHAGAVCAPLAPGPTR